MTAASERTRRELLDIVSNAPAPSTAAAREIMQRNRRRDSRAEVVLRRALHRSGLRFRIDHPIRLASRRPVRPDIVFTRARVAVFVDGCFWHGCPAHGRTPKSNTGYWEAKIALNRDRDERQTTALGAAGWTVVRIWEHEPTESAAHAVSAAVRANYAAIGTD